MINETNSTIINNVTSTVGNFDFTFIKSFFLGFSNILYKIITTILNFIPIQYRDIVVVGLAVLSGYFLGKLDKNFAWLIYSLLALIIFFNLK